MKERKRFNPFYVLLLLSGVAFAITACAYGVMTVRQLQSGRMARLAQQEPTTANRNSESFNELVDRLGANAMIVELVLLGIGTFGAIAYDQRLDRLQATTPPSSPTEELT